MTNKEAREILEKLIPQPQRGDGKSITHLMITEALTMAIKALEQEPCEDCISRQAVLEKAIYVPIAKVVTEDKVICRKIVFVEDIQKLPSVTPKTGHWIEHEPFDNGHKNCNECIECSQCHTWLGHDCYAKTPYCPMCGAKMVEPQESEDKE